MSVVREALVNEMNDLVSQSKSIRDTILNSKTNLKKRHYKKKLKKNNTDLMNILVMLQRLTDKEDNK